MSRAARPADFWSSRVPRELQKRGGAPGVSTKDPNGPVRSRRQHVLFIVSNFRRLCPSHSTVAIKLYRKTSKTRPVVWLPPAANRRRRSSDARRPGRSRRQRPLPPPPSTTPGFSCKCSPIWACWGGHSALTPGLEPQIPGPRPICHRPRTRSSGGPLSDKGRPRRGGLASCRVG